MCPINLRWKLLIVVVEFGRGSKVLRIARKNGIPGGTIFLGHGSLGCCHKGWLTDESEAHKEILLMVCGNDTIDTAMAALDTALHFHKPNHGIAFTLSVSQLIGSSYCRMVSQENTENEVITMHQAIFVIVNKGDAETVVQAAEAAGANGATVVNGRGAGIHETSKLFAMEIEPEKEVVMIVAARENAATIAESVRQAARLDVPGQGILFVLDVDKTYGVGIG